MSANQKRIYVEIRLECESEAEKKELADKISRQARLLGLTSKADYIRTIVEIDAATSILKKLKEDKK